MKITDKKNITRNLDMKVNLRGGGQINLKPLAQIADSVEPKNYRDITITGLTPEELESKAVKDSIKRNGFSEEELEKLPEIYHIEDITYNANDEDLRYVFEFSDLNWKMGDLENLHSSDLIDLAPEYICYRETGGANRCIFKREVYEQGNFLEYTSNFPFQSIIISNYANNRYRKLYLGIDTL
jgi:hypothetical protein